MSYFEGKFALVTGAGSGIGRALAIELNRLGCHLWLSDINETSLNETAQHLTNKTANHKTRVVDCASLSSVKTLASEINNDIEYFQKTGVNAIYEQINYCST